MSFLSSIFESSSVLRVSPCRLSSCCRAWSTGLDPESTRRPTKRTPFRITNRRETKAARGAKVKVTCRNNRTAGPESDRRNVAKYRCKKPVGLPRSVRVARLLVHRLSSAEKETRAAVATVLDERRFSSFADNSCNNILVTSSVRIRTCLFSCCLR